MNFDRSQFTVIPDVPPPGWERETPKYKVTRNIQPAQKARFRYETPFAESSDSDTWQYGERELKAHEVIESREWPHASFRPLNFVAKKLSSFLTCR